jgi:hypothetical protein
VRTIADVVSTLEQRQRELKDKLRDAGLLDDEYDDEKVLRDGLSKYMSPEARAAMGHMLDVDVRVRRAGDFAAGEELLRHQDGVVVGPVVRRRRVMRLTCV